MKNYVDSIVTPVPKKKVTAYLKMAQKAGKIWIEHGALAYNECAADDVQKGKLTSFPRSVKLKATETVFVCWIVYKNRKHRDQVLSKVMNDSRLEMEMSDMPFDGKRMIWGGFKPMISLFAKSGLKAKVKK
jgi:uncharacterized protein YbaA (DUF1428 family)